MPAGGPMAVCMLFEWRLITTATLACVRAAWRKQAPRGRFLQRWHDAGNFDEPLGGCVDRFAEVRHGAEQSERVRMARPLEQFFDRRLFDLAACVHHDHP